MFPRNELKLILLGLGFLLLMHLLAVVIFGYLIYANPREYLLYFGIFAIGLVQFIYVVPMVVIAILKEKWAVMKGVIIGAVLTALLNGGCWLIFAASR